MKIAVIGTGYVGLVTGACFAGSGNSVICVDIDKNKVEFLKQGKIPFFEPRLDEIVLSNVEQQRLFFTTDITTAVKESFLIFIAVGTPQGVDGDADISAVLKVARSIGENLNGYKIVITKSTVPVGTTEKVRDAIKDLSDIDFGIASNPEFLKEGDAVEDFLKPERVVIGVEDASVGSVLRELYSPFMLSSDRTKVVSIRSSEMSKYASNAMLATRISFMNEIANLCELLGSNISEVRSIVGSDSRIGKYFLYPGVGYGGSCFPKDVKALEKMALDAGYKSKVITAVDQVNTEQRNRFFTKIKNFFGDLSKRRIAVWGLSFKPNTDDIRDAPSLYIISKLLDSGCSVAVHDPAAMQNAKSVLLDRVDYFDSYYDACQDADALSVHTEWRQYRQPSFEKIRNIMKTPVVFDGRNIYDRKKLQSLGFNYFAVGR